MLAGLEVDLSFVVLFGIEALPLVELRDIFKGLGFWYLFPSRKALVLDTDSSKWV